MKVVFAGNDIFYSPRRLWIVNLVPPRLRYQGARPVVASTTPLMRASVLPTKYFTWS